MKKFATTLIASLCLMGTAQAQDNNQNYVMKRTMLNDAGSSYINNIQYYDGLGRPFQSVEYAFKSYTQTGSILATLQEYDTVGRESDSWLPISISGSYLAPSTFKSNAPGNYGSDARPYSHKVYENSPLDRLTESYRPGSAWSTKPAKVEYAVNTTDSSLNCIRYSVSSADALVNNGNYARGTLRVTKATDEDGKVQYTFTDKQGQKLLERAVNESEYLDTYYVYDDYGCLRFVLQPEYQTTASLDLYAFQYKYDSHNNCIWKKLPGAAYMTYEYDAADRMIFSQDGVQRASGKWTFYVYDSLGRLTQQGENTSKAVAASGVYLQNYYDNYVSLRSALGSSNNSNYPDDTSGNSRGFLTGTMTKVLGTSTKLYTAFYYDIEGKVTKKVQQNLLGGHDITTTTYSFSGQPLTVTHAHTATGKTARTEVVTYTYDEKDRVSMVKHKLGSAEVTLASYTYDTFGRMATRKLHGSGTNQLNYSYNIQNWLTGISSGKFSQALTYNNGTTGFNGNISSMNWNANGASHSYTFTYDGVNRMLDATHGTGAYTEKVTLYDKNGNIKALQRYGNGLIDNLTYTYNGNQLTKVEDATGNAAGFSNGASAANEYTYDNNGNLTKDSNKNISSIAYNCLNLPSKVTFSDGSTIVYSYVADGTKLRTVHVINGTTIQKDYCANVVYENGVQKLLLTEEGYVDLADGKYYYNLKDHQGNNRVVIDKDGDVKETNHYYPFGGVFASTGNVQPYKYNGKELDTKKGLNWYDYGARHYDAALGRFTTIDPKAEDLMKWSLYSYCYDNPIKFVDPDGKRGRPAQRPIRRGLRNGGRTTSIYGFFNLPKPQSTQTVTTYKYRGGMLREKMALGKQNYLLTIQTLGGNSIQSNEKSNYGLFVAGLAEYIDSRINTPDSPSFNLVSTKRYSDDGCIKVETDIIFNDPILSTMQAAYEATYRRINDSLGEINIEGKNLIEILQLLNERRELIINEIGLSPKELLKNEFIYNGGSFQVQSTHSLILPEFIQGY